MLSSTLDRLSRRQVQFQRLALVRIEFIETPVEDGFRRADELDDHTFVVRQMLVDRRIDRGQLQREQDLRKEALLGPLEPAARGCLGAAVERLVLKPVDNPGEFKRGFEVLVDDRLSRGGDNAKERGVGAQCRETDHHVLRIISQGVEPLHQTGISLPRRWNVARRRRTHQLQGLSFGLQIGLCVVVGRVEADVSQPTAYDGDVYPGSDKVNGGRVPEAVRCHMF